MLSQFGDTLSRFRSKEQIQTYVEQDPARFKAGLQLIIENNHPYSWRAAWVLSELMTDNDKRVRSHVKKLINILPSMNHSLQREVLKMLFKMEINEDDEGYLYDHCVAIWKNLKKQPAARYYAFKMLLIIAGKHPELLFEVHALASQEYIASLSPGIGKSFGRMLQESKP